MRKIFLSIYVGLLLSLFVFSSAFGESGPLTHKPNPNYNPSSTNSNKVENMQNLKPDLTVTEINEDSLGNIIVKIKNIGNAGLKEDCYQSGNQQVFIELTVEGKSTKNALSTVDSQKVLMRPGSELLWNTGRKVWENSADTQTEVIVRIDPFNQLQETNKNNNELRKTFRRFISVKSDLIVKSIYRCTSVSNRFCIEFENKGNKEFKGGFSFVVDVIDPSGRRFSLSKGQPMMIYDRNGAGVAEIQAPSNGDYRCKNLVIPPNKNFRADGSLVLCEFPYIFAITPDVPECGFNIQIWMLINEEGQPEKRPKFDFHITR